ncbi:MAG: ATP-binding cassette domain-containing protein [Planctomycetaceae bacterium]|jgi:ABC-2 type transport system ATP-binding protein|nr:ATP-binding cassette domain-containing protein [Planctomycetaceae bacterium]MBT6153352.1 ATP-binding cassette domain-containing protein [Planctomycetaceae bacterium]MBT6486146.1 ATP-binding cassette domain-containing protein [Planctomycetaceae bacterium]MBT6494324.1 ATP-binding cassette domain-containing protein [Planctomycetaceae bacterium]
MNAQGKQSSGDGTAKPMIEARGLSKYYGPFVATQDVTFTVPAGQVAAFLGPNGAGKSTTMKLLTGFLAPNAGEARIGGFNVSQNRIEASRLIGYLPENGPLYNEMTPRGILRYLGQARGMSGALLKQRMEYVAEHCALDSVWGKPVGKLSRGFRQRVGMGQALLHDPEVLILDEPTSGLDPNQVHDVRELIIRLGKTKTILLSTHILQEVRAVCSRVILINEGRVVLDGSIDDMEGDQHDMEQRFRKLTNVG